MDPGHKTLISGFLLGAFALFLILQGLRGALHIGPVRLPGWGWTLMLATAVAASQAAAGVSWDFDEFLSWPGFGATVVMIPIWWAMYEFIRWGAARSLRQTAERPPEEQMVWCFSWRGIRKMRRSELPTGQRVLGLRYAPEPGAPEVDHVEHSDHDEHHDDGGR